MFFLSSLPPKSIYTRSRPFFLSSFSLSFSFGIPQSFHAMVCSRVLSKLRDTSPPQLSSPPSRNENLLPPRSIFPGSRLLFFPPLLRPPKHKSILLGSRLLPTIFCLVLFPSSSLSYNFFSSYLRPTLFASRLTTVVVPCRFLCCLCGFILVLPSPCSF